MVWDEQASNFKKLVIAFSFALRAVPLKLIGRSFVMELDIKRFMLSDGAQALNWRAGTVSAAGDRLRSAKQLEAAGEAEKQFDSWSEVGRPSAAQSHAALVTGPYAVQSQALVHTGKPLICLCSELWCIQTVVPEVKEYLCCWGLS